MPSIYDVMYAIPFRTRDEVNHWQAEDLGSCERFLVELLEGGFKILGITREGVPLSALELRAVVRRSAELMVEKHRIGRSGTRG